MLDFRGPQEGSEGGGKIGRFLFSNPALCRISLKLQEFSEQSVNFSPVCLAIYRHILYN